MHYFMDKADRQAEGDLVPFTDLQGVFRRPYAVQERGDWVRGSCSVGHHGWATKNSL